MDKNICNPIFLQLNATAQMHRTVAIYITIAMIIIFATVANDVVVATQLWIPFKVFDCQRGTCCHGNSTTSYHI